VTHSQSVLESLSVVDVQAIDNGALPEAAGFWCKSFAIVRDSMCREKIPVDSPMIPMLIRLARVAVQFSMRLRDPGPISTLLGMIQSKSFTETRFRMDLPLVQSKSRSLKADRLVSSTASTLDAAPLSAETVLRIGVHLSNLELYPKERLEMMASLLPEFQPLPEEVASELLEFDSLDSLKKSLPRIKDPMSFLFIKHIYERQNNCDLPVQFHRADFYSRLLESAKIDLDDEDSILPAFIFVSGESVSLPRDLRRKKLCAALALSNLTKSGSPGDLSDKIRPKAIGFRIRSEVRLALKVIGRIANTDAAVFGLMEEAALGNFECARKLLNFPECLQFLRSGKGLHDLIKLCLGGQFNGVPKACIETAAAVFKMRQCNTCPSREFVRDLIFNIHDRLKSVTYKMCSEKQSLVHLCFAGYQVPQSVPRVRVSIRQAKDFIADYNDFEVLSICVAVVSDLIRGHCADDRITGMLYDIASHYVLSAKVQSVVCQKALMGRSPNEHRMEHVLMALEEKANLGETMDVLAPILRSDDLLLETVASYFIKSSNFAGFEKIAETSLRKMVLKFEVLDLFLRHNATEAAKSIRQCCEKGNMGAIFAMLGSLAVSNSSTVLAVYRSLNHSSTDLLMMMESIPEFSGGISEDLAILVSEIIGELPAFSVWRQHSPVRLPSPCVSWKEDTRNEKGLASIWPKDVPVGTIYTPINRVVSCAPIDSTNLLRLFVSVSNSTVSGGQEHAAITEIDFSGLTLDTMTSEVVKSKYAMCPVHTRKQIINSKQLKASLLSSETANRLAKRMMTSPFSVAAVTDKFLIIADSNVLRSYDLSSFDDVSCLVMEIVPLSVIVNGQNIAVASTSRVVVYRVSETGVLSPGQELELSLKTHASVISIHWVTCGMLAIVCTSIVKVFNLSVPESNMTELTLVSGQFSSAVFTRQYAILALSSGQIAVESDLSESKRLRDFVRVPGIPIVPVISYCESSDLLFVTAPGTAIQVMRLFDLLTGRRSGLQIRTGWLPGEMTFLCRMPSNPNMHVFVNPNSGGLIGLEFLRSSIEVCGFVDEFPKQPINPLLENRSTILSTYVYQGEFYAIENDGSISCLKSGFSEEEVEIGRGYNVPESFWDSVRVVTDLVQIRNSFSGDYHGEKLRFRGNTRKAFEVTGRQLIVGFHLNVESTGGCAVIKGRRIPLTKSLYLPLRQSEVKSHAVHVIEFISDDVTIHKIDVYAIDESELSRMVCEPDFDWKKNSLGLFDFEDKPLRFSSLEYRLCGLIAECITGNVMLEADYLKRLIELMYCVPEMSSVARSVLIRISEGRKEMERLWCEGLLGVIEGKKVHANLWNLVWRDYELFDPIFQRRLAEVLWGEQQFLGSVDSFIAAFH
jgi:hypothetical protein